MSDFLSFARDIDRATEYGRKAALAEIDRPGIHSASAYFWNEFNKAVLNRYTFANYHNSEVTTSYVQDLRVQLKQAYYGQPLMRKALAKVSESAAIEIDGHAEFALVSA